MAITKVQNPDGTVTNVDAPDGATEDEILAYAKSQYHPANAIIKSLPIGNADAALSMGSGFVGKIVGDVAGLGAIPLHAMGAIDTTPEDVKQETEKALQYQPRTAAGEAIAKYNPLALLGQGIGAVGDTLGKGADWVQQQLPAEANTGALHGMAGNLVREATNQAPALLGLRYGPTALATKQTALDALRAKNQVRDAALQGGQDLGYKTTPADLTQGTLLGNVATAIANPKKLQNVLSRGNAGITDEVAHRQLGMPMDTPITPDSLQNFRNEAARTGYAPLRDVGDVPTDAMYHADLTKIAGPSENAATSFPGLANDAITKLTEALRTDRFDSSAAVDQISALREKADQAFRNGEPSLGRAYKGTAKALEDQIARHLENQGPESMHGYSFFADTLPAFQKARQDIATSYAVQKALQGEHVSAQKLGTQLAAGKPLSGDLRKSARFANIYPESVATPKGFSANLKPSLTDYGIGAMSILHNPLAAAGLAVRPLIRGALNTKLGQSAFSTPSYAANPLLNMSNAGVAGGLSALGQEDKP